MKTNGVRQTCSAAAMLVCGLSMTMGVALQAQQAVPPPPRPAGSGPTLAETMTFLQQRMGSIGKVSFISFGHNVKENTDYQATFTRVVSNVQASTEGCRFSYHYLATKNGSVFTDTDISFSFREVQDVVVEPFEQYQRENNARRGNPHLITQSSNPPITQLVVRHTDGNLDTFSLMDPGLADRIAKAMTHAIELCGGGNKDPF